MFDSVTLVWKPLGPTWTQMGSPAASGLIDLCFPTSLAPLLSPHPGPSTLCALTALQSWSWWPGFDRVAALSVTNHVTLAKLLSHRMRVMSLPPHSGAGRTRVRVRALVFFFFYLDVLAFREDWDAAIHGVPKSRTRLSDWTELNWASKGIPSFLRW